MIGGSSSKLARCNCGCDIAPAHEVPLLRHGENPTTIIGFEVERMVLSKLSGIHAPRFVAAGDFSDPYIVMKFIFGASLLSRLPHLPPRLGEVAALAIATKSASYVRLGPDRGAGTAER